MFFIKEKVHTRSSALVMSMSYTAFLANGKNNLVQFGYVLTNIPEVKPK